MTASNENYIVITTSTIIKRDEIIKQLYASLTSTPTTTFTVQQDQVNRIKIFHNVENDIKVLIRVYIVLVIPVIVDLSQLSSIYGVIDFKLDETIQHLSSIVAKLQSLQGRKVIKGSNNGPTFEQLVRELSGTNA
jgi:hypothetical protein